MKIGLATSTAVSAVGSALDVLPHWIQLVLLIYAALCGCVLLGLVVARDVRKFLAGE